MKVVIAVDSFKGSLSSVEAGKAIERGIRKAIPKADVYISPVADGGEGTVDALVSGMKGTWESIRVTGPLGKKVNCKYGILQNGKTAVMEMAGAAGLPLVPVSKRNPLITTTYGVGEVVLDAIRKGCRHFMIGLGGSATNDGGVGMLQALGYEFLDRKGKQIPLGAAGLERLAEIRNKNVLPELQECTFRIACDVTNPLCGEYGCSAVFGPQKGAADETVIQMDGWLFDYAILAKQLYPHADAALPGTGAAGGLGFAFLTFTNAKLEPGIKIILEESGLENHIKDADFVVTGEGCLDGQTVMGKAPIGVAKMAKIYDKPVIAFSGCAREDANVCNEAGIDAFFVSLRNIVTRQEALESQKAFENLEAAAEQVFRLICILEKRYMIL